MSRRGSGKRTHLACLLPVSRCGGFGAGRMPFGSRRRLVYVMDLFSISGHIVHIMLDCKGI